MVSPLNQGQKTPHMKSKSTSLGGFLWKKMMVFECTETFGRKKTSSVFLEPRFGGCLNVAAFG